LAVAAHKQATTQQEELSGVRKAAILLASIHQESAALILKQLDSEQMEAVTREIAHLQGVPPEQRREVVDEFHRLLLARAYTEVGGLPYAKALLSQSLPKDEAERILEQIERQYYARPFTFLHRAESENLLTFIQDEHPQTIALILAHLPPQKASEILAGLPEEQRVDVIKRVSQMEQTSPEVIKEVEKGLEHRLSGVMGDRLQRVGGVESVAEILNLVDRTMEKDILDVLGEEDPELVEQVRRLMFVFEDILLVNDMGIQAVLKEVETGDLVLALRTATEELKQKMFGNMSERAVAMIREEMECLGPVRLSDVEMAQQKIVDVVRRLEDSGEIIIAGRGEEKDLIV
jgi:flagellar motor switch protein FliG